MRHAKKELQENFSHIANLPTLPEVASRLMRMINDPDIATPAIAAAISQDVSLSSKVLRLANSAFYGMPGKITSIDRAVVILGLKVITTIILSVTVFDLFPESRRSRRLFDRKAFWLHSLGCGLISRYLARHAAVRRFLFDPEEAFCAGLLHDIGKVVMEQYLHEQFHAALDAAHTGQITLCQSEKLTLGFTHADAAAWLVAEWGLPAGIREPLEFHHQPRMHPGQIDTAGLCQAADWLCYQIGLVIDSAYKAPDALPEVLSTLDITPSLIEELRETIPLEIENSSIFLSIHQPDK